MIPATSQRIYMTLGLGTAGRLAVKLSLLPPDDTADTAVLILRGNLPEDWPIEIDLPVDPQN